MATRKQLDEDAKYRPQYEQAKSTFWEIERVRTLSAFISIQLIYCAE